MSLEIKDKHYAAVHVGNPAKSFSASESNEAERRGWDEETYRLKNHDMNNHYDITRKHLNFEINGDGEIVPLGSNPIPLHERLLQRLDQLGFKQYKDKNNPSVVANNSPNCTIGIIVSGDHDVLTRLAFGDQRVDFTLKTSNADVRLRQGIKDWAKDTYAWACERWGEENIIGFDVHCDETTPHIHIQTIPVAMTKARGRASTTAERGKKECVSFAGVWGKSFYVAQAGEGLHQLLHVVAVDRSEIAETERLEEVTLFDESRLDQEEQLAEERHSLLGLALAAKAAPHSLLETVVARRRCDAHQVFAQAAHRTVDRDAVVVEYHQHVGLAHAGVVECLEGLASGHGAVADDGDMLTVGVSLQFRRDGHAQRRRYRGRGMAGTESVVWAFAHLGEAAEPALGPYGLELVVAAGKDLVGVSLVSHVPYQLVVRSVEHIMQRHSQFHGAQRRSQVAGMDRQGSYDILPQLGNHLLQLADGQLLQALGIIDFLQ